MQHVEEGYKQGKDTACVDPYPKSYQVIIVEVLEISMKQMGLSCVTLNLVLGLLLYLATIPLGLLGALVPFPVVLGIQQGSVTACVEMTIILLLHAEEAMLSNGHLATHRRAHVLAVGVLGHRGAPVL